MAIFVSITDARTRIAELVTKSDEEDVVLIRRSNPAAVMMSVGRHAALMEAMEDLEDRLSIYERSGDTVPFEQAVRELGLDDES